MGPQGSKLHVCTDECNHDAQIEFEDISSESDIFDDYGDNDNDAIPDSYYFRKANEERDKELAIRRKEINLQLSHWKELLLNFNDRKDYEGACHEITFILTKSLFKANKPQ
ncbi:uncharacterized protein LOC130666868 isoform X2 [Microplitis mediator]|uniref:uncharacterized protein LOC130666868 isoform X2 n=1 Tax=Microplitis mediator TaxID=375433 RepID=UPI002553F0BB|nr:uncharacterized protein LOC130666868 isoform X2 [Microplitis mediator]